MSSDDIAIRVQNLSKCYTLYDRPQDRLRQSIYPRLHRLFGKTPRRFYREFWALNEISFQVRSGETLGIIGRNGSGKSTLLQLLAGTLTPTHGEVDVNGRIAALLELGSGFNPEFTGRENVLLNGRILGLNENDIEARYDQIVAFADIGEFIDQPVKTYSSGMFVRLAFAVQAHIDASIVIIDEALAVGDVFFRQKCYARLDQLRDSGVAILLVSHSMPDIEQYCERALLLDRGTQQFIGPASEAAKHYYLLSQGGTSSGSFQVHAQSEAQAPNSIIEDTISRPPSEAFFDLSKKSQVSSGQARCVGVALCNANGDPCNVFRQGDVAIFYYEFELNDAIGVPICGIVVKNDRGVIVFGKNSWQYDTDTPAALGKHAYIACQQEVKLELGIGEYVFEIGLSSVSVTDWSNRAHMSHEEMTTRRVRICHVSDVGFFSIGFAERNGVSVLTHHGVANLPGNIKIVTRTS